MELFSPVHRSSTHCTQTGRPDKQMDEINYLAGELTDEFLYAQANAGDYLLDKQGFQYRLTQDEIKLLVLEGLSLLFIDVLKGK
jgi:hypothetical protein